jgi:hypothetical protein
MLGNYSTRDEKIARIGEKTLIIGVDIARGEHCGRMYEMRGREIGKMIKFKNSHASIYVLFDEKPCTYLNPHHLRWSPPPKRGLFVFFSSPYVLEEYLETKGIKVVIVNSREVRGMSRMAQ